VPRLTAFLLLRTNARSTQIELRRGASLHSVPANKVGMLSRRRRVAEAHQVKFHSDGEEDLRWGGSSSPRTFH